MPRSASDEACCVDGYPDDGGPVPALLHAVSRLAARGSHLDQRLMNLGPFPIPVVEASPCGN
ncbi:hypothetical protein, partial [uncultured Gordonia sp.]|uniref:hypothetical protein n=1 Tax=uncultured Gordonia sp. TaxID=198437 RepID=UPI00258A2E11